MSDRADESGHPLREDPDTVSCAASSEDAARDRASAAPAAGTVVAGKYLVERVLGSGGMGVVVAATHVALGERVALKFLTSETRGAAAERFRREAQIAVRLKSEHVTRLMDVGTLDTGSPYLVMEYLEGENLSRVLSKRGPLPIEEAIDFVLQAGEAVAEAHGIGIVHRDLKPSNLFLTRRADGSPLLKVLDFGIAKRLEGSAIGVITTQGDADPSALTAATVVLGSPYYMSPEQVRSSRNVDARADVWSLGVILHELLTGKRPFDADSPSGVLASIAADEPVPLRRHLPGAPRELEAILLRCFEKDPKRRWQTVAALATALGPLAAERSRISVERAVRMLAARESAASTTEEVEPARAGDPSPTASAWGSAGRARVPRERYVALVLGGLIAVGAAAWWRTSPTTAPPEAAAPGAPTALAEVETRAAAAPPPRDEAPVVSIEPPARPVASARASMPRPAAPRAPTPAPAGSASTQPGAPAPAKTVDVEAATATRH